MSFGGVGERLQRGASEQQKDRQTDAQTSLLRSLTDEFHEFSGVGGRREQFLGDRLVVGGQVAQELGVVVHHVAQQARVNVLGALRQRPQQLAVVHL